MMAYLRRNPVCLILWDGRPPTELRPHERVMDEMLRRYPAVWRPVFALPGGPSEPSAWTVFEYAPQRR